MAKTKALKTKGVRIFPPPPKGFDVLAATKRDLVRHGIPQRPDPRREPSVAALWERLARRYQGFEHLKPQLLPGVTATEAVASLFGLSPLESCGFELFNSTGPITIFSGTWTVPNLNNTPNAGRPNAFRTFFGLGFLDVHVEMSVDVNQNITSVIRVHTGQQINLPVKPGDAISATLCLQTNSAGTAFYGLANETTSQTVNLTIDTGFPPAVKINAGISRGSQFNGPFDPLARFGVVYFDELVAFTPNGNRFLTNGTATTMTDSNGSTLATPQRISDFAFKVIRQ
ncbi:MAG TPA: G1 family glutamic endopeptidase [Pyrinomonadaceae bacterium]